MSTLWELDFYSRPVLDENQKKRWEILICEGLQSVQDDPAKRFRYSKFVSNKEVNSIELKKAIAEAIEQAPEPPTRIRFFRYSMQNMIIRSCEEMGFPAKVSRRALALQQWLEDRYENFYPQQEGYQPGASPSVSQPLEVPQPLPDALLGQQWAFVNLAAGDFAEMPEWEIDFSEAFPLELTGVEPDTPIPGLLIFSPRALPLAGWMSGLELASIKPQPGEGARLLLETGSIDTWILANLSTPELKQEAAQFQAAKQRANGVHFVGVQASPEAESFAGLWLLQERTFG
ncbi:MAG: Tab2/Atab2 family RNA-binding protein [Cyanobacteria bacterium P01_D01_bin.44]